MQPEILVYSTQTCPYCTAAKALLTQNGLAYQEIDVTGDDALRAQLIERTGRRTVPQIFIGGQPVGGFDDLRKLDLRKLTAGAAA